MKPEIEPSEPPNSVLARVRNQSVRYFRAVHGDAWVYKAPEQWQNMVERWMWALACGDLDDAEATIARIEQMAANAVKAKDRDD